MEKQPNPNYVNQQNAEAFTYTTLQSRDGSNQEYQHLIPYLPVPINLEKHFLLIGLKKNTDKPLIHFFKDFVI